MPQKLSRYRAEARTLIESILVTLPATATRKDAERALRAASSVRGRFAGDGLCWASQCWQRERREALARRFGPAEAGPPGGEVVYTLWPRVLGDARLWLDVRCSWCGGAIPGGCLLCAGHHRAVREAVGQPTFRALREDAARDPALVPILADWLKERGIDVEVLP